MEAGTLKWIFGLIAGTMMTLGSGVVANKIAVAVMQNDISHIKIVVDSIDERIK